MKSIKYTGLFGIGLTAATLYYFKRNKHLQTIIDTDEDYKDTTRPQYESFGANWGNNANKYVMDKLDTGDVVLTVYNCSKLPSLTEYLYCKYDKIISKKEFNGIGLIFRSSNEFKVLYENRNRSEIINYEELYRKIFIKLIKIRKLKVERRKFDSIEKDLYLKCKTLKENFENHKESNILNFLVNDFGILGSKIKIANIEELFEHDNLKEGINYSKEIIVKSDINE